MKLRSFLSIVIFTHCILLLNVIHQPFSLNCAFSILVTRLLPSSQISVWLQLGHMTNSNTFLPFSNGLSSFALSLMKRLTPSLNSCCKKLVWHCLQVYCRDCLFFVISLFLPQRL